MKCPVCGFEIDNKTAKCPDCDFNEFKFEFLNRIEYENWMLSVVVPHRDSFVDTLKNDAVNCIQYVKQLDSSPNRDLKKRDIVCDMCQKCLDKIDSIVIDWLIKSTAKIEYIEHRGSLDYCDDTTYTFDFSNDNMNITYARTTPEQYSYGKYENAKNSSNTVLKELFAKHKLHDLKHFVEEEWYLDGAWWEMKIHLRYPIVNDVFSKESLWTYHEQKEANEYVLKCDGQFNDAHHYVISSIGKYIEFPPKNIKIEKYDETNGFDVW